MGADGLGRRCGGARIGAGQSGWSRTVRRALDGAGRPASTFKTVEESVPLLAGSIPVRLRSDAGRVPFAARLRSGCVVALFPHSRTSLPSAAENS